MPRCETEKDAYIAASQEYREAQQTRIEIADAEAHLEERVAGDKAAQEYNALQVTNRGWGTSLEDLEELRTSE